jgi:hypothetical protein
MGRTDTPAVVPKTESGADPIFGTQRLVSRVAAMVQETLAGFRDGGSENEIAGHEGAFDPNLETCLPIA